MCCVGNMYLIRVLLRLGFFNKDKPPKDSITCTLALNDIKFNNLSITWNEEEKGKQTGNIQVLSHQSTQNIRGKKKSSIVKERKSSINTERAIINEKNILVSLSTSRLQFLGNIK